MRTRKLSETPVTDVGGPIPSGCLTISYTVHNHLCLSQSLPPLSVCGDFFCQKIPANRFAFISTKMSETLTDRSLRSPPKRPSIIILHAAQLLLAINLLGLYAYGVHHVAYSSLIYCIVVVSMLINYGYSTTHGYRSSVLSLCVHTSSHVSPASQGCITPRLP